MRVLSTALSGCLFRTHSPSSLENVVQRLLADDVKVRAVRVADAPPLNRSPSSGSQSPWDDRSFPSWGLGRRRHVPALVACSGRRHGSVVEAGGGTARHTRAWSVGAPAVVAGCLRLRFGLGASKVAAVRRPRRSWAVSAPSEVAQEWPMTANDDHQAHEPTAPKQQKPSSPRSPARLRARGSKQLPAVGPPSPELRGGGPRCCPLTHPRPTKASDPCSAPPPSPRSAGGARSTGPLSRPSPGLCRGSPCCPGWC
jgi:hypothetical protein